MRSNRRVMAWAAGLLLLSTIAAADFNPEKWRTFREVTLPAPGPEGFVGVKVDGVTANSARSDIADLRLIGSAGNELPYVVISERDSVTVEPVPARISSADSSGDKLWLVLDLGAARLHNQIQITLSGQNYRRPLAILISDDGESWETLRDGLFLFNFSGLVHVTDDTFTYDPVAKRFLKVEITKPSPKAEEFRILDVRLFLRSGSLGRRDTTSFKIISAAPNKDDRCTDLLIDLGHKNLGLDSISFTADDPEFYRKVEIRGGVDFKTNLGGGVIHRYRVGGWLTENLTLPIRPGGNSKVLVKIFDYDSPPLHVTAASGTGPLRLLAIRPTPGNQARLFYGNPKARAPIYDLAVIYPKVTEQKPLGADDRLNREVGAMPLSTLSVPHPNPSFIEPLPPKKPLIPRALAIWLIIIPAAAILGVLLFRSFKGIKPEGE